MAVTLNKKATRPIENNPSGNKWLRVIGVYYFMARISVTTNKWQQLPAIANCTFCDAFLTGIG